VTITQELRERREERRLSLEEVREQLGIPIHYLEAMEGVRSPLVADDFYLVPYVRRYAEFLDVNPVSAVGRFLSETRRDEPRPPVGRAAMNQRTWTAIGIAVALVLILAWLVFG